MKLKMTGKLGIGFGGMILISLILGALVIFNLNTIDASQDKIRQVEYPSVKLIMEMESELSSVRSLSYEYAIASADEKSMYKDYLEQSIEIINKNNEEYKELLNEGEETKLYEEYISALNDYLKMAETIFSLNDTDEIEGVLSETQGEYEKVTVLLNNLHQLVSQFVDDAFDKADKFITAAERQIIIFLIASIIFSIVCGGLIALGIIRSTKKILDGINRISEGDLSVHIDVDSEDEMKMIGDSTNNLVRSLSGMVESIKEISEKVAESSEELSATCEETSAANEEVTSTVNELAIGAAEQSEAVTESSNIINRMSDDIKSVAVNADSVSKSSERVLQMTNDGMDKLDNAIEKIKNVETSTNEVAVTINTLGNQSEKIGQIVMTIQNIAEQTNLLALNAAIEAARAGEQGKGFAVVAEEVRKLAEDSSASAQSIAELIAEIQKEILAAVQTIDKGSENVTIGVEAVSVSGQTFKNIFDEINTVVNQIKEVDIISKEALKCSSDVVSSIEGISQIAQDAAANAQEVASSAEEQNTAMDTVVRASETLAELGNELQNSISIFKC